MFTEIGEMKGRCAKMTKTEEVSTAMEIRDAIGQLADGLPVDPQLIPFVRAAAAGPCPTADRGAQSFIVDVAGCVQFNVDTEELIWPLGPGKDADEHYLLLAVLSDRDLWERTRARWDEQDARAWTAFVWRVAVPLCRHLAITAPWR
jgi:hypothetical protein